MPTVGEYIDRVEQAVSDGTRRAYSTGRKDKPVAVRNGRRADPFHLASTSPSCSNITAVYPRIEIDR